MAFDLNLPYFTCMQIHDTVKPVMRRCMLGCMNYIYCATICILTLKWTGDKGTSAMQGHSQKIKVSKLYMQIYICKIWGRSISYIHVRRHLHCHLMRCQNQHCQHRLQYHPNQSVGKQIYQIIIYQCYVYRTNIRHIPPEVAWECDTTSVIRRKHAAPLSFFSFFLEIILLNIFFLLI